ncbi:MAG: oligosaccharide flippase family protein [bacterium]
MNLRSKAYNLLRWSETHTQTDMVYVAKGGFWLVFGQILTSGATFLLAIAFANFLPKETYGIYKYILSVAGFLGFLTLTGMNVAVTQAVARGYEGALKKSFRIQIQWGLILFLTTLAGAVYYFTKGNQLLAISFLIIGLFSPLLNSANTYTAFLGGKKYFRTLSFYSVISVFFTSIALFLTLLATKNPLPLIIVYFISNTVINIFFYLKTINTFKPNLNDDPETISYGKHLSIQNVIATAAAFLDTPLLFHFFGAADVAVYSFAVSPPEQIKAVFKNVGSLALPKFSEKSGEEIKKTILRKVLIFSSVIALAVAVYIFIAPLAFKIFFPKYVDSVFYSQIYAISIIATAIYLPNTALQSQIAKKELYYFNISTSILQIILLFVFIYFWGILGAVLSRVATRFINLAYSLWLVKKI